MAKITITIKTEDSKTSITHKSDSIVIKVKNEEEEETNFELGSVEGASIKIEETGEMYVKGGMKVDDLISRVNKAECAITQINNKLLEGYK